MKRGASPRELALCIAVAAVLGVFPVLGVTTLLCAAAALMLRLNLPAMQLVNYLVYPLQFLLLLPFIRAGEVIFGVPPLPLSASEIAALVGSDPLAAIDRLWWATLRAVVAWGLAAPLVGVLLYWIAIRPLRRLAAARGG